MRTIKNYQIMDIETVREYHRKLDEIFTMACELIAAKWNEEPTEIDILMLEKAKAIVTVEMIEHLSALKEYIAEEEEKNN